MRWTQCGGLLSLLVICVGFDFAWIGRVQLEADKLQSQDPQVREAAISNLAQYDISLTRPHLLAALSDGDPTVRIAAGQVLAHHKVEQAVPTVVEWLTDPAPSTKQAAARILGDIGSPLAVQPLVRSLGDPAPEVRYQVVLALGSIGTPDVVVPLLSRLEDSKHDVRRAAVQQLLAIGDSRAVIPLLGVFSDSHTEVRVAAVQAVGRLGDLAAVPALVRLLSDANDKVRLAAVTALGNLRATAATDTLIAELEKARSADYKAKVAYALGQIGAAGEPEALRVLVAALERPELRAAALEALRLAGTTAVPMLVDHLEGKLPGDPASAVGLLEEAGDARATLPLVAELQRARVRKVDVLGAIGACGDSRALVPVLSLLEDDDPAVRPHAMLALRPLLDARAADVLIGVLDDRDLELRILAVEYLGIIRASTAVPPLIALAKATSEKLRLRYAAITALGEIGVPDAAGVLLAILTNGPQKLHRPAALALGQLHPRTAIKPLLALASEPSHPARIHAVKALTAIVRDAPSEQVRTTLEALATGDTLPVGIAAIDALGAMGDPASVPLLVALAGTSDAARSRAAYEALGNIAPDEQTPLLLAGLASRDDRVSATAAWALGKARAAEIIPALLAATRHRGWATAVNASAALVRHHCPSSPLRPLLQHANPMVRANAATGLGATGSAADAGPLARLLENDSSWLVRAAAARALGQLAAGTPELQRAATTDAHEQVRAAATAAQAGAAPVPARDEFLTLYVVDPDSDEPVPNEPYVIAAADGLVTAHYTDINGHIAEEQFPAGPYFRAPRAALE